MLTKKRLLVAKTETGYGVDPVPTGAQAIQCSDLSITPLENDAVDRVLVRPYFGGADKLLSGARVKIEATVELTGSGAAGTAPNFDALLRACGMAAVTTASVSVAYNPISAGFESATIYYNQDGLLHKATGCRGTWTLGASAKGIPTLKFSLTGIYNPVVDAAALAPTFSAVQIPLLIGAPTTATLHGFSGRLQSLNINLGANIAYRELVGYKGVEITDRDVEGDITIEMPTIATKDWFSAALNVSTGALAVQHGTVAGNIVQIDGARVSVNSPSYEDSDGFVMLKMGLALTPVTGNDEVKLTFR
ncbi:phage tail tube protein [Iodobacter sp. CM08]|uniref:phage tail tube protein n=1 Tax=Iodobacter sp. CM08 TaxID=3085902 RepID=UPI00298183A3|nr:phage tail tube protein [Iodobacter sp. CM08]MDW5417745.1 phage tail tube protein [Iodobacter sp. CM08]